MVGIHLPGYVHHLYLLGIPTTLYHPVTARLRHQHALGHRRWGPGLKPEINKVKKEARGLRTLRVLEEKGGLCAELLRLSRKNNGKDRIDEGAIPLYTLWCRHVAHSGHPSSAIRSLTVNMRRRVPVIHPV